MLIGAVCTVIHFHMYTHTHIHTCICTHNYIYISTQIHTQTHTHIHAYTLTHVPHIHINIGPNACGYELYTPSLLDRDTDPTRSITEGEMLQSFKGNVALATKYGIIHT